MLLPKISAYRRYFVEIFLDKRWWILENYHEIWEKIGNRTKKEFDSEPIDNENYLQANLKSYDGKNQQKFSQ